MLKLFTKYASVGVLNTLIHWVVFASCFYALGTSQALANFSGFVVAVSFSFFANARFTFNSSTTTTRYMLYVGFMGTLSAAVGWAADKCSLPPVVYGVAGGVPDRKEMKKAPKGAFHLQQHCDYCKSDIGSGATGVKCRHIRRTTPRAGTQYRYPPIVTGMKSCHKYRFV